MLLEKETFEWDNSGDFHTDNKTNNGDGKEQTYARANSTLAKLREEVDKVAFSPSKSTKTWL